MVSPAALSIVTTTFREGPERTKALSVWAAIAVGGAAIGLLLGGVLTEYLSWEWVFFVNVPVGIVAILLSLRFIPESRQADTNGIDVLGAISVTAGLTLLVYAIVKTQDYGWLSAETIGMAIASAALLTAFVFIELRSKAPLVRLSIFRQRALTGANLAMLAVTGGMFAVFYFASLYVQQTLGFTPVQAGLAFMPADRGHHPVLVRRPAADRADRGEAGGAHRHVRGGHRPAAAGPHPGGRQLRRRRAARHPGDVGRPRA